VNAVISPVRRFHRVPLNHRESFVSASVEPLTHPSRIASRLAAVAAWPATVDGKGSSRAVPSGNQTYGRCGPNSPSLIPPTIVPSSSMSDA
jgi:hypothetical protein